jgi:hypothetical protein
MSTLTRPPRSTLPLRVPWTTVVGCVAVAALCSARLHSMSPAADWTLTIRLAQLALAGGAAYLLDDASAVVTAAAPRPLWIRRLFPLAIGISAIGVAWSAVLLDLRHSPGAPIGILSMELAVLVALSVAISAVSASYGEPEPGNSVAVVVPLAGMAAILVGGLTDVSLYPSSHGAGFTWMAASWAAVGIFAITALALKSRD